MYVYKTLNTWKNSRRTINEKAYEAAHDAALNLVNYEFCWLLSI